MRKKLTKKGKPWVKKLNKSKPIDKVKEPKEKPQREYNLKPGHTLNKGKNAEDPIRDYLVSKLEAGFPLKLVERLSKGLRSRDSKIFLDTFKAITKHIAEPVAPVGTSPVVQALLDKHYEDVTEDIKLLEDTSSAEARETAQIERLKDK